MHRTAAAAYLLVLLLACAGLYAGAQATSLAREVDNRGDIRSCEQDNLIRSQSSSRDAALEETARLTAKALVAIEEAAPNPRLRKIIRQAQKVQVEFKPTGKRNCAKEFPSP
jgi:di/tripeptidase